ncbi:MAG: hypothetical protein WDO74_15960 [Pseudomonadota bacterium]
MWRSPFTSLTSLMLLSAACSSSTTSPFSESGEDSGGASASAGSPQLPAAGASASAGASGSGAQSGSGGGASGGASGAIGGGGASADSSGSSAGASGSSSGASGAAAGAGGSGGGGSTCPGAGHITYTLAKSAAPTATEQAAYDRIKIGMDKAIGYYDCYTSITKSLKVSYVPSVETADGNINGSIRFGMNTTYMDYRSAMHEIGHTVGIGQASNWGSFLSGGLFTGEHAAAQLNAINAKLKTPLYTEVHADTQHFWPYGINQQSEVKGEADLIAHCQMVVAIRQDLGL